MKANFGLIEVLSLTIILVTGSAWSEPVTFSRPVEQEMKAKQSHYDRVLSEARNPAGVAKDITKWTARYYQDGKFEPHPWFDGREESEWKEDWQKDSAEIVEGSQENRRNNKKAEEKFFECMEPRLVKRRCEYCEPPFWPGFIDPYCHIPFDNRGTVIEYWWPTYEVEINNFGISAINPVDAGYARLARDKLLENLKKYMEGDLKDDLREYAEELGFGDPEKFEREYESVVEQLKALPLPVGQTHYSGNEPVDQTTVAEAHVYLTELQDRTSKMRSLGGGIRDWIYMWFPIIGCIPVFEFHYNGFMKGSRGHVSPYPDRKDQDTFVTELQAATGQINGCFYDTLEPAGQIPRVWTEDAAEEPNFLKYWRIRMFSKEINEELYNVASPEPSDLADITYLRERSCMSYRVAKCGNRYQSLKQLFDIKPSSGGGPLVGAADLSPSSVEDLSKICYCGGGQLYPLVGTVETQSPLVTASYLARRGAEVAGQVSHKHLELTVPNHCSGEDHVNRFTRLASGAAAGVVQGALGLSKPAYKEIDKLQILYPRTRDKDGEKASKCYRVEEVDEFNHELFPPDIMRPEHLGSIRFAVWEKRMACFCPYRGAYSALELQRPRDTYSSKTICIHFPQVCRDQGWGCQIYPRLMTDVARGNVEEDLIWGEASGTAKFVPACYYPFDGRDICERPYGLDMIPVPAVGFPACTPVS